METKEKFLLSRYVWDDNTELLYKTIKTKHHVHYFAFNLDKKVIENSKKEKKNLPLITPSVTPLPKKGSVGKADLDHTK